MPAPQSTTRMSTCDPKRAGFDANSAPSRRPTEGIGDHICQRSFEQRRIGCSHDDVVRNPDVDRRDVDGEAPERRVHRGVDRDRLDANTEHPGLEAAHVEKIRHERVQPVGFGVDRLAERLHLGRRPLDVGAQQARRSGLDVGERCAQVVRDGREQCVAQIVCLGQGRSRRGFGLQTQRGLDELQLRDEGAQQPSVLRGERAAGDHQHRSVHELGRIRGVVRSRRYRLTGRGEAAPAVHGGCEYGDGVEFQCPAQLGHEAMLGLVVEGGGGRRELIERLDLGLPACQLRAPPRKAIDEAAHQRGDRDEHDEGQGVPGVREPKAVRGRDVEPVGHQERDQRGDDRRDHAAQHCDGHRREQEQQQRARDTHGVAERQKREDDQRDADDRTEPGDGEGPGRARRSRAAGSVRQRPALGLRCQLLTRDDVDVDRTGGPNDAVDHRSLGQLGPP